MTHKKEKKPLKMTDEIKSKLEIFLNWNTSNFEVREYLYLMDGEYLEFVGTNTVGVSRKIYSEYKDFVNKHILNKKVLMALR